MEKCTNKGQQFVEEAQKKGDGDDNNKDDNDVDKFIGMLHSAESDSKSNSHGANTTGDQLDGEEHTSHPFHQTQAIVAMVASVNHCNGKFVQCLAR